LVMFLDFLKYLLTETDYFVALKGPNVSIQRKAGGIGFCVILPKQEAETAIEIAKRYNVDAFRIGHIFKKHPKKVNIKPKRLCGHKDQFYKY
jgi:hypothetical protein